MGRRIKLKLLRTAKDLNQIEMAAKIGVSRMTYANIENGTRYGSSEFWEKFQRAFGIPDSEMWGYINDGAKHGNKVD